MNKRAFWMVAGLMAALVATGCGKKEEPVAAVPAPAPVAAKAIVIGLDRIHNKDHQLRFPDEFARHKTLDLLGDLFLLGCRLEAHVKAVRPGHGHNINFVKLLAERFLTPQETSSPAVVGGGPMDPRPATAGDDA